jgi:hypothetical protein
MLENRFPAEKSERFISLAAELAKLEPDVLVAVSRPAAPAAGQLRRRRLLLAQADIAVVSVNVRFGAGRWNNRSLTI